jgi:HK97 family phage portal protein
MSDIVAQRMLDQLAFKELALQIGVSYIANTLSKCEFKTYRDGEEVQEELYYKLNVSPNPNQNSSQFINKFVEQYYYHGGAVIVNHKNNLYCADSYTLDDSNPLADTVFEGVVFGNTEIKNRYKSREVFHIQLDNKKVKDLVDSMYLEYGKVMDLALASYKRTNGARYKLLLSRYKAGDPEFQKQYEDIVSKQLKSYMENPNSVYVQHEGYDLQAEENGGRGNTSDIIAMRRETFEVVAQALKIPLSMMYGNITNMDQIVQVYLSICIDPLADMISEELTRKYFSYEEWKAGCRVVVDTSCINHVDILAVGDDVDKLIASGAFTIDDVRKRLNHAPLNTEFSGKHFITKNYTPVEEALKASDSEPSAPKGGE